MNNLFLIIGLGNPGPRYDMTRHNVGFRVIDLLCEKYLTNCDKLKHKALISEIKVLDTSLNTKKAIFAKPQTYMNLSGESAMEIINWYKIELSNIILIYDDIDLQVGKIRIRPSGSAGTHNGMKSIIQSLGSKSFPRIRIGIGKPPAPDIALADYVLSKFSIEESTLINSSMELASEAALSIINNGINFAMNKYNF